MKKNKFGDKLMLKLICATTSRTVTSVKAWIGLILFSLRLGGGLLSSGVAWMFPYGPSNHKGQPQHKLRTLKEESELIIDVSCIWLNNLKAVRRLKKISLI
jgi:hypothetical protein